ncbi:hypothetical protein MTR67_008086 [Solanum verrucosum]|uniref:Uncharacterized protein n=1 Tax=Solanum verrucosum TaxID=315347 RepID=A0AAF0Q109_SOLVR|nr:hypothetical protein MTR67_008086 [Solanum verrucosum]
MTELLTVKWLNAPLQLPFAQHIKNDFLLCDSAPRSASSLWDPMISVFSSNMVLKSPKISQREASVGAIALSLSHKACISAMVVVHTQR